MGNLQEKIDLVGYQANPFPLIKNADLFVLTSLWEGFGNVLVEAITLDTPVVSTNCLSGPNDILLDGQGGDLIEVNDIEALAKSIERNLYDKEYSFGLLKNAKIGCERFKLENIAKKYIELFKELKI
jgi:glycosyltransferase involved in cell wall biosynthesis